MLPPPISDHLLKRQIAELRNPRYLSIYEAGRERCLQQALAGNDISDIPIYSYNATYQSLFCRGWQSVSAQDIRLLRAERDRGPVC
ncbi:MULTISPECIES: hypothetical protein [Photorhabdus]|uniref:hypothetical protein n=1 Tax=Photorhabdus TaxID=29487 RepID=UPI0007B4F25E|nr:MULTISPECIES: hypothetical protein [Photorhabdus]AXG42216.1 hypothetical protein PluDJC_08105 [Photorhabdus laumondii subsp. laumondii]AXG42431.1 hypothetical protein PluDJC_09285 [Photorhabdus laumondii subsp. laumondii]MBS9435103.1 hypothetical protein [Photorhabdus hainanensis]MBS9438977.1 hypothetical protein [Photorhabdus noenieputensis]MCC8387684.1 hypothetical protein [Photorhabdus laumondii]